MERICSFAQYVLLKEGSRLTSSKTGLYPLGYGGIGLYPDADYLTHAADAILYLTQDERLYNNQDSAPWDISHLPGHELANAQAGIRKGHRQSQAMRHSRVR